VVEGPYAVRDLPPEQFQQAYPLIQLIRADWALDQWLDYAAGLYSRPGDCAGILSVQTRRLYIYALATYEFGFSRSKEWSIQVHDICVVDFLSGTVRRLLVDALERRARTRDCLSITVRLREASATTNWSRERSLSVFLEKLGYIRSDDLFFKKLKVGQTASGQVTSI